MTARVDGSAFGMTPNRFDFTCASAGITDIFCSTAPDADGDIALDSSIEEKTEIPRQYHVIVLNDDYTPMAFVIRLLMGTFRMDLETAMGKTSEIDKKGSAICGTYTHDIAYTRADQVIEAARKENHPLMAIAKPA